MITCQELENLRKLWAGEVCIFGAGQLGKGIAYELIIAAGFSIDFYCDNHISPGTYIRDDLIVRDIKYLYEHNKDILVFLCVSTKYRREILEQFEKYDVKNFVVLDISDFIIEQIMEEVDKASDEVKRRWHYFYDDVEFLTRNFKRRVGYDLDLEHPKTFNEKLQWLKLYDRKPEYIQMVDKYEVKKYVADKIGEDYIIPTLGIYDTFDEIEFDKLPQQFVLKCTHDSGSVVICKDKDKFDRKVVGEILNSKLQRNFYWVCREWPYKNVKPRIIAEKYMSDESNEELKDYKFFVFNGKVKLIQVDYDRFKIHKRNLYTTNWEYIEASIMYPNDPTRKIKRPQGLEKMIELSEKLSEGIPHVRADFYSIEDKVYFGELTFYHGGGYEKFRPVQLDVKLGEMIKI